MEAALRLSAQEAGVAAGGGGGGAGGRLAAASGGKKGARKGKAASPDKGAKKGKGSSLAAALTGGGKGGKGSAYFAVDIDDCGGRLERAVIEIGARQTITSLNKKWLAKPIRKGLVEPFVSQLAPHLKSQGIEIASDEIIISVDGRQIEGMEAASFFVSGGRGTADEPVPILLTLPFLPPASAILADPSLASWPGAYPGSAAANSPHAAAALAKAKAAAAAASSSSAAAGGGVHYHEHPNRLESATFHVDISTAGKDDVVPTETTLQKKWLAKPLRQGLVLPALKAYMAQSWQADLNHLPITILVDGIEVDGTSPGAAYVRLDGETTTVAIILPPDALAPGAKAQMTFQVYIDDTGWTTPSETTLNKKWMMKPLLQALVEPALKHHCKSSALPPVPLHEVKIAVDGVETDGSPPAWTFLQLEGRPVRIDLALPVADPIPIRRISRGGPVEIERRGSERYGEPFFVGARRDGWGVPRREGGGFPTVGGGEASQPLGGGGRLPNGWGGERLPNGWGEGGGFPTTLISSRRIVVRGARCHSPDQRRSKPNLGRAFSLWHRVPACCTFARVSSRRQRPKDGGLAGGGATYGSCLRVWRGGRSRA